VGFGTLAVCSVYPGDTFYGSWTLIALILTLPVTIVSFGYRFAEAHILYPVYIIQFVMFLIMFSSISIFYKSRDKKKNER
jgi:hypothetical protein